jgi:hypothetical protein
MARMFQGALPGATPGDYPAEPITPTTVATMVEFALFTGLYSLAILSKYATAATGSTGYVRRRVWHFHSVYPSFIQSNPLLSGEEPEESQLEHQSSAQFSSHVRIHSPSILRAMLLC